MEVCGDECGVRTRGMGYRQEPGVFDATVDIGETDGVCGVEFGGDSRGRFGGSRVGSGGEGLYRQQGQDILCIEVGGQFGREELEGGFSDDPGGDVGGS